MSRTAEAMEEFVNEFERYIDFVDSTQQTVHAMLINLQETTFAGELATKFEDLVRADTQQHLTPLHDEFSAELLQLRADIEYIRNLEAGNVNI